MKTEFLKSLGLTNSEINVYLSMLPLGNAEAKDIYKLSRVPFGKIYNVLYSLERKGLVIIQYTRPKGFQAVVPGMAIKNLLNKKDEELSELSNMANEVESELGRLYREQEKQSQFWTVMMDRVNSMHLLGRVFDETEHEALIYFNKPPSIDIVDEKKKQLFDRERLAASFMNLSQKGVNVKLLIGPIDNNTFLARRDIFTQFLANDRFDMKQTKELIANQLNN